MPYAMHMARAETIVQLTTELRQLLDAEAERRGTTRSGLIREAIVAYLADAADAAVSQAITDGYRRIPPGTPDGWGDLEGLQDRSARDLLQRLDAEERAAGLDPW